MPSSERTNVLGTAFVTPSIDGVSPRSSIALESFPRTESEIRRARIWENLGVLYPDKSAAERASLQRNIYKTIARRGAEYRAGRFPEKHVGFTEKDAYVITYPDSVYRKGNNQHGYDGATMDTFEQLFTGGWLNTEQGPDTKSMDSVFSGVQLLPHQEASHLDRGFSQKNPYKVDPKFGSWENVKRLAKRGKRVTVDQLVNHMSMEGEWFKKGEIEGDPDFQDLFESYHFLEPPHDKYDKNFKPREHDNWTLIENTARGPRWYRTTFGDKGTTDQVDLDYHNSNVLLKQLDISLFNVSQGALGIRMDSMAFTWKEPGGKGINEPQVKNLLQIFRDVIDEVNPAVRLLSENNVPQKQNIESLGKNGEPLSHIVYDFGEAALGPHGVYSEQAGDMTDWMLQQPTLPDGTTKIIHVSCHDGIFLQEAYAYFKAKDLARGIPEDEAGKADMDILFKGIEARGGRLAMRKSPKGEVAVYELDATLRSVVSEIRDPDESEESEMRKQAIDRDKHLLLYAVASAIQGVPAVFLPSLVGKRNDEQKFAYTGMPRDLLRVDMDYDKLVTDLNNTDSEERKTYDAMMAMLKIRTSRAAFRPNAPQEILTAEDAVERVNGRIDDSKKRIFGVRRMSDEGDMVALHNFSSDTVEVTYENETYTLGPYKYRWEEVPARSGIGTVIELFKANKFKDQIAA